jgi:hypothetical protein
MNVEIPEFPGRMPLFKAIDALAAYDHGATDSGIRDPDLRAAVKKYLEGLDDKQQLVVLGRIVRECLSEESLAAGYGVEDAKEMIEWLDELLGD